jgi:hypothetical protein
MLNKLEAPPTLNTTTPEDVISALGDTACYEHAYAEVRQRLGRNFTNLHFGLFLLAVRIGNTELEQKCYRQLHRLGFGILSKRWPGYYRHYGHPTVWRERIDEVLTAELEKNCSLYPLEIWNHMVENRFAYLYRALWCQFADEWRNYYRHRGREVQIEEFVFPEPAVTISAEEREAIAKELEDCAAARGGIFAEALRQSAAYERDPDGWEAMYGRFPMSLSRAVAEARGVDKRTAQCGLRALRELAQTDEGLQGIRAKLEDVVDRTVVPKPTQGVVHTPEATPETDEALQTPSEEIPETWRVSLFAEPSELTL